METTIDKANREAIKFFQGRHNWNLENPTLKPKWYPGSVCYDWLKPRVATLPDFTGVTDVEILDSKTEIVKEYFTALNKKK